MGLEKFIIEGGRRLKGEVVASGSKNSALPIMAATILAEGPCSIGNVPRLRDVDFLARILGTLGVSVERDALGRLNTKVVSEEASVAPYELVSMMRASFCVLGPLLAKRGYAKVSLPGGCAFGDRPVDLHLKGLRALGADIKIEHGYVIATAKRLRGANIYLGGNMGSSVLGTGNVMMAAVLAEGQTVIEHAACEPEVVDLANFLISMGASIEGAGSHRIRIRGVRKLEGCSYEVIPDRIEAATLLMAGAITRGEVIVKNIDPTHLEAVFDKFKEAEISFNRNCKVVSVGMEGRPKEVEIATLPYPGFPTDLQAQMMALMCFGMGASVFIDGIYPDRLNHVAELKRMGARVLRVNNTCVVIGSDKLQGAPVMASDLRAGAALVLAALAAEGETEVKRIYHIDRGYDNFEGKLRSLGASIKRAPDEGPEKPPMV
ncbi:MAG TPA: UDP-N-acetylglucosamine 1-carboxyvinyltransferase [Planctomycetota bacterium]|nr:UDP-N-acetylglucosamine 1-carboxyvinyltransferase [Planctomycetota bacterium]